MNEIGFTPLLALPWTLVKSINERLFKFVIDFELAKKVAIGSEVFV